MAQPNKVGLAEALRQRELDEEDRESSTDGNDDWATGPDSPKKTVRYLAYRSCLPFCSRFKVKTDLRGWLVAEFRQHDTS